MITVCTLTQAEQWDSIVRTFVDYDVYWLSDYVKAFYLHGDGEPLLIFYNENEVKGINVVMKRDISKIPQFSGKIPENQYFDFSTPYGYGGWLIEGKDKKRLFSEYEKWCKENRIISEFVRFHPVVGNHTFSEEYYDVIALGHTVAMKLDSQDVIWDNISSKNRNMIRKAEKSGIEIRMGNSEDLYKTFTEIYNSTMQRDNAADYYYFKPEFYDSVRCDLEDKAKIFYAVKDSQIIAASIIIYANGYLNYHLSGSLVEFRNFAPSNLLLYKAALWGNEIGCRTFHLGGGVGSGEDNLFKFKRAFYRGDDLCRFYIGKKIFDNDKYTELVGMREEVHSSFFPKYRA